MTDVGREVYRRITTPDSPDADGERHSLSPCDTSFAPLLTETSGSSHRRRIPAALQNNSDVSISKRNGIDALPTIGQLRKSPQPEATLAMAA